VTKINVVDIPFMTDYSPIVKTGNLVKLGRKPYLLRDSWSSILHLMIGMRRKAWPVVRKVVSQLL